MLIMARSKAALLNMKVLSTFLNYLDCGDIYNLKDIVQEFRQEKKYKKLFKERMFALVLKVKQ